MKRSPSSSASAPVRWLRTVVLAPLLAYQRFVSPALPRRCKYYPTCSAYAVEAVRELGVVRGTILAAWRLVRCNPFSHGGYDPVSAHPWSRSSQNESPTDHRAGERAGTEHVPAGSARERTRSGAFRANDGAGAEYVAR